MKTIQWFLLLTRCHFQPLVTFGHSWLEMAPRERQKPFHFLHTSDGKQILISGIQAAGGYEKMLDLYNVSVPDPDFAAFKDNNVSCSAVNQDFMHLVRPPTDDTMPWTG